MVARDGLGKISINLRVGLDIHNNIIQGRMIIMDKTIMVSDIYLKAFLAASGVDCEDIEVSSVNGKRTINWVYEDSELARATIVNYREDDFTREFVTEYLFAKTQITAALKR